MKLIFVRHGLCEWNKLNQFTVWMDTDLSEQGYDTLPPLLKPNDLNSALNDRRYANLQKKLSQ